MQTITSVEAQNNFGRLMNSVPREPIVITKYGRNYAIMLPYDEPVEFGTIGISELHSDIQTSYHEAKKLSKSAFVNF